MDFGVFLEVTSYQQINSDQFKPAKIPKDMNPCLRSTPLS